MFKRSIGVALLALAALGIFGARARAGEAQIEVPGPFGANQKPTAAYMDVVMPTP